MFVRFSRSVKSFQEQSILSKSKSSQVEVKAGAKLLSKVQFSKVFVGFSSGLCYTHLISFIVPERRVRSDNYFALERLQKQSLWRRKKDGKSAKNFPSSPSCPLRVLLFRQVLLRNSFQQLLSCPRENQKKSAQLGGF